MAPFFVLIGLYVLLGHQKLTVKAFLASLAFALAGQMKEVFAFTLFAMVPLYLKASLISWRYFVKAILATAAGLGVMLLLTVGYLVATNSVKAYQEVLISKSAAFKITDLDYQLGHAYPALQFPVYRFIALNYSIVILIGFAVGLSWLTLVQSQRMNVTKDRQKNWLVKFKVPQDIYGYGVLVWYWFGAWLGYIAQNRYGNKYDIAMIFATHLVVAVFCLLLSNGLAAFAKHILRLPSMMTNALSRAAIFVILLLVFITPGKLYPQTLIGQIESFSFRHYVYSWQNLENPNLLSLYAKIKQGTQPEDCIQGVYGWGISSLYLYSERKSCSRFFIPNIITNDQIAEYRSSLTDRPPAVLYYAKGYADLDIEAFEAEVFNYAKVKDSCYEADPEFLELHWPRRDFQSRADLRTCIKEVLVAENK